MKKTKTQSLTPLSFLHVWPITPRWHEYGIVSCWNCQTQLNEGFWTYSTIQQLVLVEHSDSLPNYEAVSCIVSGVIFTTFPLMLYLQGAYSYSTLYLISSPHSKPGSVLLCSSWILCRLPRNGKNRGVKWGPAVNVLPWDLCQVNTAMTNTQIKSIWSCWTVWETKLNNVECIEFTHVLIIYFALSTTDRCLFTNQQFIKWGLYD